MKNNNKIRVSYEPDADVLSMMRGNINTIDHAEEMGDVVLHVNAQNEPVLVEILNASQVLPKSTHSVPKRKIKTQLRVQKTLSAKPRKPALA